MSDGDVAAVLTDQTATEGVSGGKSSVNSIFETITNRITLLGGIVAAIVTVNSSLSSCSKDNIERYATFRSAVDSEEKFWNGLYDQYLGTFEPAPEGVDPEAAKAKREEKLRAIQALANHTVPDFREHQLGLLWSSTSAQAQASANIAAIKKGLIDALTRSEDPQVARSTKEAIFAADEAQTVRTAADSLAAPPPAAPVPVPEQTVQTGTLISYQSQTLSAGDPKGWDVDLFWCAGASEAVFYGKAAAIAQQLADAANAAGSRLTAADLLIGRVRLRSLPAYLQGNGTYPATGRTIWVDADPAERGAGTALLKYFNATQAPPFALMPTNKKSAWYMSVFICS
ncbi:hypothetical protein BH10PSE15_BH10PSE15_01790 [soil metagenome]